MSRQINYREMGGLSAEDVESLVKRVASQFFKGDDHQRQVEASREVFKRLTEDGPFDSFAHAFIAVTAGLGQGKSHASAYIDSKEIRPIYHSRHGFRRPR